MLLQPYRIKLTVATLQQHHVLMLKCHFTLTYNVIGHDPKLLARWLMKFLKRCSNYARVINEGRYVKLVMVWKCLVNIILKGTIIVDTG